ncbi:hypothetical protein [Thalassotalea sp. PS06]|uniref:hypothetical protein n=1 Tax=Thalassotalea sp. PS06 TaxID=2594005 RepID=UPI0011626C97|nr:hypothetical protein [Thalassotalea sp. PS06]QDP00690.1 hypothetical protein FNC98_04585 [Thalassotalea sp. PS06]
MPVDHFINEKISQLMYYLNALLKNEVHPTELNLFIWDCFEEWNVLQVTDDTPNNARERVFWHLLHELKLGSGSLNDLDNDWNLKFEIESCMEFLQGQGRYPIHCVGWRPV